MMQEALRRYGACTLLDIEADELLLAAPAPEATHIRQSLPVNAAHCAELIRHGYSFADRTLDVAINLARSKTDFSALVRSVPELTSEQRDDVAQIALESFPTDSRFHFGGRRDSEFAQEALKEWVRELGPYYLCIHKGVATGFLALRESQPDCRFIHLAAVGEKYRAAGIAVSLYAHAAAVCKADGVRLLEGRISSSNVAVMNLYAFLGATFSNPRDVYVKEV